MSHIFDKLLFLVIIVVTARVLWRFYPYRTVRVVDEVAPEVQAQPQVVQQQMDVAPVAPEREEVTASPLFVRYLDDRATLMVRYRHRKRACTAHLIVWSSSKRGYSDSYLDLGIIEGQELTDQVIEQALALAMQRLEEMDAVPVPTVRDEVTASPLIVRHLGDMATVIVRYRKRKQACTAHLIIWSGNKKKSISDSYFDLGTIEGQEPTEQVVEQALALAKQQIDVLAAQGKRKRRETKKLNQEVAAVAVAKEAEAPAEVAVEAAPVVAEQSAEVPPVVVEDTPPESIKLKKFPSVYRGVIKEIGMMTQNKEGREFETFGVRFQTQEGIIDAVFGVNLREALRDAKANVGDQVEILKIGRKTITRGKAPMNLFKVAKLQCTV